MLWGTPDTPLRPPPWPILGSCHLSPEGWGGGVQKGADDPDPAQTFFRAPRLASKEFPVFSARCRLSSVRRLACYEGGRYCTGARMLICGIGVRHQTEGVHDPQWCKE